MSKSSRAKKHSERRFIGALLGHSSKEKRREMISRRAGYGGKSHGRAQRKAIRPGH